MKTIVCPTDFSRPSNNALRYALTMAQKLKARVIMLHVYEIPIVYSDMAVASFNITEPEIKGVVEKKILALRKRMAEAFPTVPMDVMVMAGLASDRIIQVAKTKKADMIVMSSTSTSALERALIGSNTSRVINNTPCQLLIIPPSSKFRDIKQIVFTTDLKEKNLKDAEKVTLFAKQFQASMTFLYVDTKLLASDDKTIETMTKKVRGHVKYTKIAGYVCNDADVANGIRYFLKRHPANMLCMITHHRNLLEGIWNKSITRKIASHLTLPLLVLR